MKSGCKIRALGASDIQALLSLGAEILDIREPARFDKCHARDSVNIQSKHAKFKERVALMFPPDASFILLGENEAQVCEAIQALWETMEERLLGYVRDGIDGWVEARLPTAALSEISLPELRQRLDGGPDGLVVLDVREPFEWVLSGCIEGAMLIPMGQVERRQAEIPRDKDLAIVCEHGVRSGTAASILKRYGFDRCLNVIDGMDGWRKAGYPRAKYQLAAR